MIEIETPVGALRERSGLHRTISPTSRWAATRSSIRSSRSMSPLTIARSGEQAARRLCIGGGLAPGPVQSAVAIADLDPIASDARAIVDGHRARIDDDRKHVAGVAAGVKAAPSCRIGDAARPLGVRRPSSAGGSDQPRPAGTGCHGVPSVGSAGECMASTVGSVTVPRGPRANALTPAPIPAAPRARRWASERSSSLSSTRTDGAGQGWLGEFRRPWAYP